MVKQHKGRVWVESTTKSGLQVVALATRSNEYNACRGYHEVQHPRSQDSPNNRSFNYHEPNFVLKARKLLPNEMDSAS